MPAEGLLGNGEAGEGEMKITLLGIVVIVVVGAVLFALYQQSKQNRNPGPDQEQAL